MSTPLEIVSGNHHPRNPNAPRTGRKSYKLFVFAWIILVSCGLTGAFYYSNYLKNELTANLAQQNHEQLQVVQADYQKQLEDFKVNVNQEMANLQTKVDQLNQLLAFTKDSANTKTDSSNQLYTQLADVKKKLEELQKNLDVLK